MIKLISLVLAFIVVVSEANEQQKVFANHDNEQQKVFAGVEKNDWISQGANLHNNRNILDGLVTDGLSLSSPSFIFDVGHLTSISATPAVNSRIVIFPSADGNIQCYQNGVNNTLLWKRNINSDYYASSITGHIPYSRTTPVFYKEDKIIVGIQGPADILVLDLQSGNLLWKINLDSLPVAIITQSGQLYGDVFYVGTSSNEEAAAENPAYPCCSFYSGFFAIDLIKQNIKWSYHPIPRNLVGVGKWAGASVWGSTPPIDVSTNTIFIATGNVYTTPPDYVACVNSTVSSEIETKCNKGLYPDVYFDSIIALDLNTGAQKAARRFWGYDAWTVPCVYGGKNCPVIPGPDFDFGMAPVLDYIPICSCGNVPSDFSISGVTGICSPSVGKYSKTICPFFSARKAVLYIGQKSGIAWAVLASDLSTIWANQASPAGPLGGSNWGSALDETQYYIGTANYHGDPWTLTNGSTTTGGGWIAIDKFSGETVWTTANPAAYDNSGNGRSKTAYGLGPPTSVRGAILVGSTDSAKQEYGVGGYVYSLSKKDGSILSSYQTGASVYGGFSIQGECAYVGSGYYLHGLPFTLGRAAYGFCMKHE